MSLLRFVLVLCVLLASDRARAGEVLFNNGDKLTGKIVKLDGGKLTIESKVAGKLEVPWSEVATMSSEEPVSVVLEGGQVVTEPLVAAEPGTVKTAGESPQTIALASTTKLNPEPVQWHGNLLTGARFDRGNTVSDSFDATGDAVRRSEFDRMTFGAGYSAASAQDSDQVGKHANKSRMFGTAQYDYFFQPKLYGYVNARGDKDRFADLNLRFTTGIGAGYQWIETEDLKFNTEAGISWVSENYHGQTPDNDYAAARVAWNLDWVLYSGLTFFQYTRWYPSLQQLSDHLVETQTGLRYKLWGDFFGESKLLWTWDTSPAEGKKHEDLSYIFGLGYSF